MIAFLQGILAVKTPPYLIINVNGVGYQCQASMQTFYQLPESGKSIQLHTHFIVREDAQQLYAFYDADERRLFCELIKVNGVGPKLAISILSSLSIGDLILSLQNQDAAALVKIPGIGKKTAERLCIELRDKLGEWQPNISQEINIPSQMTGNTTSRDAISALVSLGYKPQEASRALSKMEVQDKTAEELIRDALRHMA